MKNNMISCVLTLLSMAWTPKAFGDVIQNANDTAARRDKALFDSLYHKAPPPPTPLSDEVEKTGLEDTLKPPTEQPQPDEPEGSLPPDMPENNPPQINGVQPEESPGAESILSPGGLPPVSTVDIQTTGGLPDPSPPAASPATASPTHKPPPGTKSTVPQIRAAYPDDTIDLIQPQTMPRHDLPAPSRSVSHVTSFTTEDSRFYIPEESQDDTQKHVSFQTGDREWLDRLKTKQSKSPNLEITYLGPSGVGLFAVRPRRTVYATVTGGVGPNSTKVFSGEVGLAPSAVDASVSVVIEKAQWLDRATNTGKLASSAFGLLCAGGIALRGAVALTPCIGGGVSYGTYKDRDYQNDIQTHTATSKIVRTASLKGMILYDLFGTHAIDWTAGYSEDIFLWGGFAKVLTSTPIPTIFIGLQTHGAQRNAVIMSSSISW